MRIAVAKGDGIGPEIMDAVLMIFKANKVPLEYEFVDMGKWVFDKGFSNGMDDSLSRFLAGFFQFNQADSKCSKATSILPTIYLRTISPPPKS